jgi:hypothetical protein
MTTPGGAAPATVGAGRPMIFRPPASTGALSLAPEPWRAAAVFAAWSIILVGALARLAPYAGNRSLWLDESFLALNIAKRSFSGLLGHLDYDQRAPVVFLMLEKAASELFGINEFALRLVPLLAGMLSLVLFYQVVRRCLRPKAALLALALFALSTSLIYYASEVKPYSSDVAATLAILLFGLMVAQRRGSFGAMLGLGGVGALCILTSFPSVFVLVGCGLVLFCFEWSRGRRAIAAQLALIAALWTALFMADHLLLVSPVTESLRAYWKSGFAPAPLFSFAAACWLTQAPFGPLHADTLGLARSGLAAGTFGLGCVCLLLADQWLLAMLLAPAAVAVSAATLHQYPFDGRLVLFLVPLYLMVIATGLEFIWDRLSRAGPVLAITLTVLLLFPAAHSVATSFVHPPRLEEIKPVLDYVIENEKRGDLLYVYASAGPAFDFYAGYSRKYQLSNMVIVRGKRRTADASQYEADLRALRGHPRVWIIVGQTEWGPARIEDDVTLGAILGRTGKCLSQVSAEGAQGYLCDLSAP